MNNDELILSLIFQSRLLIDPVLGFVYAPKSNTPSKPCGAQTRKGYLRVCINIDGHQKHFMAHRIVWVSVHGPLPPGFEIDHKSTIKTDNRIENLEAVSGIENMKRGARNGCFKGVGRKDGIRDDKGRFGKRAAGRLLDGRDWLEMPQ